MDPPGDEVQAQKIIIVQGTAVLTAGFRYRPYTFQNLEAYTPSPNNMTTTANTASTGYS